MDDNTTAVLFIGEFAAVIIAVVWIIYRSKVKVRKMELEKPPPEPEDWSAGYHWRDGEPRYTDDEGEK